MTIGIDFDGVIAYTNILKKRFAKKEYNIDVPAFLCDKTSFCNRHDSEKYTRMTTVLYSEENTKKTPVVPGAVKAIKHLSKQHTLVVITNRTQVRMNWAAEWLQANGILNCFYDVLSSNKTPKIDLCRKHNCDILIDDDLRHFKHDSRKLEKILFKYRGYDFIPADDHADYTVCRSWKEVIKKIGIMSNGVKGDPVTKKGKCL